MTIPTVSVCMLTYQHVGFIAQAIEGALMQKTDFLFEILIGEDESNDGTREICQNFAQRYPQQIRLFLRNRRDVMHIDGRARGSFNFRKTLLEAKGEFIALCEGDDFWTDPSKLQRQVDFLRANPDCVGCFHDAQLVDGDGRCLQESYFQDKGERFTQAEVLGRLLSRQPTCSMVFRKSAFAEPLPEWFLRRPSDLYLDILITGHGSLGFIRRNMSAYRKHAGGIWSGQREAMQIIELIIRYKLLLADPFFLSRYKELILTKTEELHAMFFTRADFDAETARLAAIVEEQAGALASLGRERDRLTAETKAAQAEANRASKDGQKHIDAQTAQLNQLAATSSEQTKHIKVLEAERDRLTAEAKVAQTEANRAGKDGQKHIDAQTAQLAQLAATAGEQIKHIKVLEAERDRLTAETKVAQTEANRAGKDGQLHIDALTKQLERQSAEGQGHIDGLRTQLEETQTRSSALVSDLKSKLDQIAGTGREQADYIDVLTKERDRLAASGKGFTENLAKVRAEAQLHIDALTKQLERQSAEGQGHIDSLRTQLDQLASTSREQSGYIVVLEKERHRLGTEWAEIQQQAADYLAVMKEQSDYIRMLELVRDQNSGERR